MLKCLHIFCKSCLEAWLRQQGGGALSCSTCRQITDCPNNDINSLSSSHFGNCDVRKSLSAIVQIAIAYFLCEDCTEAHKALRGHHVKEIENSSQAIPEITPGERTFARNTTMKCGLTVNSACYAFAVRAPYWIIFLLANGLQKKKSEIQNKMQEVQANIPRLRSEKESLEK